MFSISGMVHLRSKALERTILKICVWGKWGLAIKGVFEEFEGWGSSPSGR